MPLDRVLLCSGMDCRQVYDTTDIPSLCLNAECKRPLLGASGSGVLCFRDARASRRGSTPNFVATVGIVEAEEDSVETHDGAMVQAVEIVDDSDVGIETFDAESYMHGGDGEEEGQQQEEDEEEDEDEETSTPNAPIHVQKPPGAPLRPLRGCAERASKARAIDLINTTAEKETSPSDEDMTDDSFIGNWPNRPDSGLPSHHYYHLDEPNTSDSDTEGPVARRRRVTR